LIFADRQPRHVEFWNPMIRVEDYMIQHDDGAFTMSTSNVTSMVHINIDVRAFELLKVVIGMLENNHATTTMGVLTFLAGRI